MSLSPVADTWTDYVGNTPIADYDVTSQIPTDTRRYVPGVAETDVSGGSAVTWYRCGDIIDSTTALTDAPATGAASVVRRVVYRALG